MKNYQTSIDKDFLKSIVENDKEFEKELFVIFTENANRNVSKMESAIVSKDNNSWYMASHAFKGAAASIGAFDLSKVLEYAQRNSEDVEELKNETLSQVKTELALVLEFIKAEVA